MHVQRKTKKGTCAMTSRHETITAGERLVDAARLLLAEDAPFLWVLDDSEPVGVLTRESIVRSVVQGRDPLATNVSDVMEAHDHFAGVDPAPARTTDAPARGKAMADKGRFASAVPAD
jgi:CBS domain-containing protein